MNDHRCICSVCEGTTRVVWDRGPVGNRRGLGLVPRKATEQEIKDREDQLCPACDGAGIEP